MITETSSPNKFSKSYFDYLKVLIDQLSVENVSKFINLILETRENNKTIFFIGNGGSASTARLSNLNIHVPTQIGEYGPAEDLHMVICGLVGSFFRAHFKDNAS